ncbi:permease-like cell division protein FtsX [soil metagenome]
MKIRYFLSETVNNLRRNMLMAVAATSTVAISLLLLGGVEILGMVVGNVTNSWEAKVEISTFLRDDASSGEIQALESEVAQMPEVKDVTYVSKAQAYEEFKETYADTPQLYEALSPDSLPASLRIALTDAQYTQEVAARIQGTSGVDEVRFGGEIIRRLLQVNTLLRTVTLVLSVILMIASAALIANTIRLGIYARREEIGIMKLVGATNWFIRIPFMLEGLVAALLGALLAAGIVWFADAMLFTRLAQAVPFLAPAFNFSTRELMTVVAALVAVGTGVGLVGSGMATRRFLQV